LPSSFFESLKIVFDENSLVIVLHPPYSPGVGSSDFSLFGHIKPSLSGRVFNNIDELFEAVIEFLNKIQPSGLQFVFHHWIECVKYVLANNGGEYHE
jgi:hypothetical protein